MLATVFKTLVALFVDDGALALATVGIVLLSWILAMFRPDIPLAAGALLVVGCLAVLVANVMIAARR